MVLGIILIYLCLLAYLAVCLQSIAYKLEERLHWMAWIPFANLYLLCRLANVSGWVAFLFPLGIPHWYVWQRIPQRFGIIGVSRFLILLPPVSLGYLGWLAFGSKPVPAPFGSRVAACLLPILAVLAFVVPWKAELVLLRDLDAAVAAEEKSIALLMEPASRAKQFHKQYQAAEYQMERLGEFLDSKPLLAPLLHRLGAGVPPRGRIARAELHNSKLKLDLVLAGTTEDLASAAVRDFAKSLESDLLIGARGRVSLQSPNKRNKVEDPRFDAVLVIDFAPSAPKASAVSTATPADSESVSKGSAELDDPESFWSTTAMFLNHRAYKQNQTLSLLRSKSQELAKLAADIDTLASDKETMVAAENGARVRFLIPNALVKNANWFYKIEDVTGSRLTDLRKGADDPRRATALHSADYYGTFEGQYSQLLNVVRMIESGKYFARFTTLQLAPKASGGTPGLMVLFFRADLIAEHESPVPRDLRGSASPTSADRRKAAIERAAALPTPCELAPFYSGKASPFAEP